MMVVYLQWKAELRTRSCLDEQNRLCLCPLVLNHINFLYNRFSVLVLCAVCQFRFLCPRPIQPLTFQPLFLFCFPLVILSSQMTQQYFPTSYCIETQPLSFNLGFVFVISLSQQSLIECETKDKVVCNDSHKAIQVIVVSILIKPYKWYKSWTPAGSVWN